MWALVSHTWASAPKGNAHATGLRVGILGGIDCYTSIDSSSPWQSVRVRELKAAVAGTRLVTIISALHMIISSVITLRYVHVLLTKMDISGGLTSPVYVLPK